MTTTAMLDYAGLAFLVIACVVVIGAYFRNIYKIITDMRGESYSFRLILRAIGVFFPVIGVIMGFV